MDTVLFVLQTIVLLGAIFLGVRIGGIGIALAAGIGVLLLGILGLDLTPFATQKVAIDGTVTFVAGNIPFDVVAIIVSVIAAISVMQVAGGLDVLVNWAERILRKNPKRVTIYAPILSYLLTVLTGTGNTSIALTPVIVEVAKDGNVRPSRPLSMAVVSSQIAITASPISAAVVWFAGQTETLTSMGFGYTANVGYVQLLAVSIPSSFLAIVLAGIAFSVTDRHRLDEDPEYVKRVAAGTVHVRERGQFVALPGARASVGIFIGAVLLICVYAILISDQFGIIRNYHIDRNGGIIAIMLATGAVIALVTKIKPADVLGSSVFKAGMNAALCIIGVAWLGTVYVNGHLDAIQAFAGDILDAQPWLLAVVLFFASALLYSQSVTAKAMMPIAFAAGLSPVALVGSFAAVSGLFILPTYPTLLAAVQIDDTGSTRIGKYIFNHPFLVPGVVSVALAVAFAFGLGPVVL